MNPYLWVNIVDNDVMAKRKTADALVQKAEVQAVVDISTPENKDAQSILVMKNGERYFVTQSFANLKSYLSS